MNKLEEKIKELEERILAQGVLSFDEAMYLTKIKGFNDLLFLFNAANKIREKFRPDRIDLCSITNAKSGDCLEDCAFCAQSSHHKTGVHIYPLIAVDEILKRAQQAFNNGAHRFCIVTSGCNVEGQEFDSICKAVKSVKIKFPSLKIDASLGKLTKIQAHKLKESGLDRYNHNIETTESFFKQVCTTHSFADRLVTLKVLKEVGIEVCCGGIIGLGESDAERIKLAFYLKELDVDCLPLNFLNPIEGTPLEKNLPPPPLELLKLISIFRLILPRKQIRICGGRQKNLRQFQSLIFYAGADAIIMGDYLTTKGSQPNEDLQMISDLGLKV